MMYLIFLLTANDGWKNWLKNDENSDFRQKFFKKKCLSWLNSIACIIFSTGNCSHSSYSFFSFSFQIIFSLFIPNFLAKFNYMTLWPQLISFLQQIFTSWIFLLKNDRAKSKTRWKVEVLQLETMTK